MKQIGISGIFDHEAENWLRSQKNFVVNLISAEPREDELAPLDALLVRSSTRVDQRLLNAAKNIKVVITSTVGYDHFDLKALKAQNVIAMHTPSAHTISAAELTWTLLLSCSKRMTEAQHSIQQHQWRDQAHRGIELAEKTLGLIGFGRVGQAVARRALAFDMNVMAFDPYLENSTFTERSVNRVGLDELLRCSDAISVHVPLTTETRHMLHRIYLENVNPGAIFINTSRGAVIREDELLHALSRRWFSYAGLDVFEKEPLIDSALLTHPRVVATPHIGAFTREAFRRSCQEAAQKLKNFFDHGAESDALPEDTPWAKGIFLGSVRDA